MSIIAKLNNLPLVSNLFIKFLSTSNINKRSENRAIRIANYAIKNVKAYRSFLKKNDYLKYSINSFQEFKKLPIIDKHNYINKYSLVDRSINPRISESHSIEGTSGFSGKPTYWFRLPEEDYRTRSQFEFALLNLAELKKHKTLFINCFAYGIWPSGERLSRLMREIAYSDKYKLTVINPGPDIEITLDVISNFKKIFDHIIISGYPPYIKDLADKINSNGFHNCVPISLVVGGEGFPENWRDYIASKLGINLENFNIPKIFSNYGVTELGTGTASETFLSIKIRRMCMEDGKLAKDIFGNLKNAGPMLLQYNPLFFFVEEINNEIIATTSSISPLIRYNIHDLGGVISFDKMFNLLDNYGFNINEYLNKLPKNTQLLCRLPFIYIAGRSDGTVFFRGANVYTENIKSALLDKRIADLHNNVFFMYISKNDKMSPVLTIEIDLKDNLGSVVKEDKLNLLIANTIFDVLKNKNKEFADASKKADYYPVCVKNMDRKRLNKKSIKLQYV